ncbi:hypothetical protein ACQZV8_12690 [Magnetococcales bacterium HHB-1]
MHAVYAEELLMVIMIIFTGSGFLAGIALAILWFIWRHKKDKIPLPSWQQWIKPLFFGGLIVALAVAATMFFIFWGPVLF